MGFLAPFGIARRHTPQRGRFIIMRFNHAGIQVQMAPQTVFIRDAFQIFPKLIALGEMLRPIMVWLKRQRIEMIGGIHAAARIVVFIPGAAHGIVLLENREGQPGFLQLDRHQQAGNASANNAGAECRTARCRHIAAPLHGFRVRRIHHGFFADQRQIFRRYLRAHANRKHAVQQMRGRFRRQGAPALRVIQQYIAQPGAERRA